MTEKDLYAYKNAKHELVIARERLAEFESVLYQARGQAITGLPSAHSNSDTMPECLHRKAMLEKAVAEAAEKVAQAGAVLDRVCAMLDDVGAEFVHYRYILDMSYDDIPDAMHRSRQSVFDARNRVLKKIRDF